MLKILNNIIVIDFSDLFFSLSNVTNTRGHRFKLPKPLNHNSVRLFSVPCRRIDCWNSLPEEFLSLNPPICLEQVCKK